MGGGWWVLQGWGTPCPGLRRASPSRTSPSLGASQAFVARVSLELEQLRDSGQSKKGSGIKWWQQGPFKPRSTGTFTPWRCGSDCQAFARLCSLLHRYLGLRTAFGSVVVVVCLTSHRRWRWGSSQFLVQLCKSF